MLFFFRVRICHDLALNGCLQAYDEYSALAPRPCTILIGQLAGRMGAPRRRRALLGAYGGGFDGVIFASLQLLFAQLILYKPGSSRLRWDFAKRQSSAGDTEAVDNVRSNILVKKQWSAMPTGITCAH